MLQEGDDHQSGSDSIDAVSLAVLGSRLEIDPARTNAITQEFYHVCGQGAFDTARVWDTLAGNSDHARVPRLAEARNCQRTQCGNSVPELYSSRVAPEGDVCDEAEKNLREVVASTLPRSVACAAEDATYHRPTSSSSLDDKYFGDLAHIDDTSSLRAWGVDDTDFDFDVASSDVPSHSSPAKQAEIWRSDARDQTKDSLHEPLALSELIGLSGSTAGTYVSPPSTTLAQHALGMSAAPPVFVPTSSSLYGALGEAPSITRFENREAIAWTGHLADFELHPRDTTTPLASATQLHPIDASASTTSELLRSFQPSPGADDASGEPVNAAKITYRAARHSKFASNEIPEPVMTGPRAWHCELCPHVQTRHFEAELRRHIHTHFAPKAVCRGERVERLAPAELAVAVAQHGPPLEHDGVLWVGGCWKAMARADTLLRHLANPNTTCMEPCGLRKRKSKSKSKAGSEVEGESGVASSSKGTGKGTGRNVREACK